MSFRVSSGAHAKVVALLHKTDQLLCVTEPVDGPNKLCLPSRRITLQSQDVLNTVCFQAP